MSSLKQIKLKRQAVLKTQKVTRAMEAVSAVKMRKSQEIALSARGFAFSALKILTHLSSSKEFLSHKFAQQNKNTNKLGILLITSDKGLAGSLNSSILKEVQMFTKNKQAVFYCIGKRGNDFAKRNGFDINFYIENKKDYIPLDNISELTKQFVQDFENGIISELHMFYTNFISTFEQKPSQIKLLPLTLEDYKSAIYSIIPERGKFSELKSEIEDINQTTYKIESEDIEELLNYLIPELIDSLVFHGMLESKASEHSARMVAMKNATDKAKEVARELLLKFNKARQAAITKEVSEITSGIEAMKD